MATDAREATTLEDSATPPPQAIRAWVENQIDIGVLSLLMGVLAVSLTVLGVCLWLLVGRAPVPVYAGG